MISWEYALISSENERLLKGGLIVVTVLDNHKLHIRNHLKMFPVCPIKTIKHILEHIKMIKHIKNNLKVQLPSNDDIMNRLTNKT